jgi:energy-coupling factor transport system substrate-specific component
MQQRRTHAGINYFIFTFVGFVVILGLSIFGAEDYLAPMSLILIALSVIPFYGKFEKKELDAEEMVLVAMLSAIAAIGRIPFAALPSVQPTSFIIIMAATTFGKEVGFLVGNMAALVSNIFLGQGPWTPWQMLCWGMIGFTAGLLKDTYFMKSKLGLCVFAFVWGFLFGWIMNLWFLIFFHAKDITWRVLLGSCMASFKFDLNHAICNVIFILLFYDRWTKILTRTKEKYGLLK